MSEHNCNCGCGCDGHEKPEALTEEMTVVLTLDDDEELECVVGQTSKNTSHFFRLPTSKLKKRKILMYTSIVIKKMRVLNLHLITLKAMKNTKLLLMHLMNG